MKICPECKDVIMYCECAENYFNDMNNNKIKVVELFAGVGGFRIGLEGYNGLSSLSNYTKKMESNYEVVWSNQWEPSTKIQHANLVYKNKWKQSNHNGNSIEEVISDNFNEIPNHDLLVGGFPCQDYSVATTLKNSKGLIGTKGVLWWSIYSILKNKGKDAPDYLFLENVDRLMVSPAIQRGRDFAVMLSCLNELGYAVEWRVINAAEYGMPQRRRRIYILAYKKGTDIYSSMNNSSAFDWINEKGVFSTAFSIERENVLNEINFNLDGPPNKISKTFNKNSKISPFKNSGIMINGNCSTYKTQANYKNNSNDIDTLRKIILDLKDVPEEFIIDVNKKVIPNKVIKQLDKNDIIIKNELDRWKYLKGSKKESRYNKSGDFHYKYAEGSMTFPDKLDYPSRTIITGEGGASPSRFKHIIKQEGIYRRLTPLELERLNMFPDNHTKLKNISDTKRAFFMGNALVVGVIEKIGLELSKRV